MDAHAVARRALGLIDLTDLGDRCTPDDIARLCDRALGPHGATAAVCIWPRFVGQAVEALAGIEVCDVAMEVAGGSAFYRGSVIERAYRDIRAAKFHPFSPEATLLHAGQVALGLPADRF